MVSEAETPKVCDDDDDDDDHDDDDDDDDGDDDDDDDTWITSACLSVCLSVCLLVPTVKMPRMLVTSAYALQQLLKKTELIGSSATQVGC